MGNQTKRVNAHEDRLRALELRKQGWSYREIAADIGKSTTQVHRYVARALQETTAEAVDDLRRLEGERLDAAQYAIWPQVMAGDVSALNGFIRLSERRAKLLGLDAPERQELSGGVRLQLTWGDGDDDANDNSTAIASGATGGGA